MLSNTGWLLTDNHRKRTIGLHILVRNNKIKPNHVALFKYIITRDTMNNCIVRTNTNNTRKIWIWLIVGSRRAVFGNLAGNKIIHLTLGHTDFNIATNIFKYT